MPSTADLPILKRLSGHRTIANVATRELEWLAAHGHLLALTPGEVLTPKTGPVQGMYFVLSGRCSIHVNRGAGPKKVMEWQAGDVTGLLPYSRIVAPPGDVVAEEPCEVWAVHRDDLPEFIRECYEITSILVHVMVDRARHFTSSDFQDEKMASLGRLAAGLAHELNNPASAVARNARELTHAVLDLEAASRGLGASGLDAGQIQRVDELRARCIRDVERPHESPLQRSDREEALGEWLEDHAADVGMAGSLADSSATFDDLDGLSALLSGEQLAVALQWIAAGCQVRQLIGETEAAATRVHNLVAAVKGFTYMDRARAAGPVDVLKGLRDTAAVLGAKVRSKSVTLTMDLPESMPPVHAIGGELNQVWLNLIDNAVDAVSTGGHVTVSVTAEASEIVVHVVDDGPGVPKEIQGRVFDPFFTTKPVGEGTGLGLDISRRIVAKADGTIALTSVPGRTEFSVSLPRLNGPAEAAGGTV